MGLWIDFITTHLFRVLHDRLKSLGFKAAMLRNQATEAEDVSSEGLNVRTRAAEGECVEDREACVSIMFIPDEYFCIRPNVGVD
jgi:hypothetical protein